MRCKPVKRVDLILLIIIFTFSFTSLINAVPRGIRHYAESEPAPDFMLRDLNGVNHQFADYRGRVVIVNFWAVWCRPCVKEMPSLDNARKLLQSDEIDVVAINVGDTADQIKAFLKQWPVDIKILLDQESNVMVNWKVLAMPTTYIIDSAGKIVIRVIGEYQWDDPHLLEQIRSI